MLRYAQPTFEPNIAQDLTFHLFKLNKDTTEDAYKPIPQHIQDVELEELEDIPEIPRGGTGATLLL